MRRRGVDIGEVGVEVVIGRVLVCFVREVGRVDPRRDLEVGARIDGPKRHTDIRFAARHFHLAARLLEAIVVAVAITRLHAQRRLPSSPQ